MGLSGERGAARRRYRLGAAALLACLCAVAWGYTPTNSPAAIPGFLAVGLLGGALLRSWRAVPLLACGIALGSVARIVGNAGRLPAGLGADANTLRLLGKVGFGLLLGLGPLTLLLALPVAAGKWLAGRVAARRPIRQ